MATRRVRNLELDCTESAPVREQGNEPVKTTGKVEVLKDLTAHYLEPAVDIAKAYATDPADQTIEDARRQHFAPPIAPGPPPSANHIEFVAKLLYQPGYIGRILLKIGVNRRHQLPSGASKARRKRQGLAEVPPKPYDTYAPVFRDELPENLRAAVRTPIINENDLRLWHQCLRQARMKLWQRRSLVVNGNHYAQGWSSVGHGVVSGGQSRRWAAEVRQQEFVNARSGIKNLHTLTSNSCRM